MKSIILYYSRSGNTEKLAIRICGDLNCDIMKIEPEEAYGNYVMSLVRMFKEKSAKVPVKFITEIPDLAAYEAVFIGFPIWGANLPDFVAAFVSQCNFDGKIIFPFITNGRNGVPESMETLKRICKDADIKSPYTAGAFKKDDYGKWLKSIREMWGANNG